MAYGEWEFMICGGGSVLFRNGGYASEELVKAAARRQLAVTVGADYATIRIALDDARWSKVTP